MNDAEIEEELQDSPASNNDLFDMSMVETMLDSSLCVYIGTAVGEQDGMEVKIDKYSTRANVGVANNEDQHTFFEIADNFVDENQHDVPAEVDDESTTLDDDPASLEPHPHPQGLFVTTSEREEKEDKEAHNSFHIASTDPMHKIHALMKSVEKFVQATEQSNHVMME